MSSHGIAKPHLSWDGLEWQCRLAGQGFGWGNSPKAAFDDFEWDGIPFNHRAMQIRNEFYERHFKEEAPLYLVKLFLIVFIALLISFGVVFWRMAHS